MRYCSKCGTTNADNAKFCKACGFPMDGASGEKKDDDLLDYEYVDYEEERSNSIGIILTAIVAVLIVLAGIVYVLNMRSGDTSAKNDTDTGSDETVETTVVEPRTYTMKIGSGQWPFGGENMRPLYSAQASSVLPDYNGITYNANNVLDDNNRTSWTESKSGTGEGEWIALTNNSGETQSISEIYMLNGYTKDEYTFDRNTTPTVIDVSVGKSPQSAELVATLNMQTAMATQFVELDEPIQLPDGEEIIFTIQDTLVGPYDENYDTNISEIHFE